MIFLFFRSFQIHHPTRSSHTPAGKPKRCERSLRSAVPSRERLAPTGCMPDLYSHRRHGWRQGPPVTHLFLAARGSHGTIPTEDVSRPESSADRKSFHTRNLRYIKVLSIKSFDSCSRQPQDGKSTRDRCSNPPPYSRLCNQSSHGFRRSPILFLTFPKTFRLS